MYNAPGSPTTRFGILGPRLESQTDYLEANYKFSGWPQFGSAMAWTSRIQSYCVVGDWACQNWAFNTADPEHNSYKSKAITVYEWLLYVIQWT